MSSGGRRERWAVRAARHGLLSVTSLIVLVPIVYVVIASLKTVPEIFGNPYGLPEEWAWSNYTEAWQQARLGLSLSNSAIVTSVSVAVSTLLSAMVAYGLSRRERPLAVALYIVFASGLLIPVQLIVLPLFVLMHDLGLLGTLLSLMLPYTAMALPIGVLVLTPLFAAVPRDLADAARIDGGSEWVVFSRIMLPLMRPGLASVVILNGVWMWNEFFVPLVITVRPEIQTVPVGIMSFVGTYSTEWGLIFASVVLATVPAVLAYVLMARQFISGMTAGAVKG